MGIAPLHLPEIDPQALDGQRFQARVTAEPAGNQIITLQTMAVAPLQAIRAGLEALAERYRDVAFDVSTPKGLEEAKKARHDLRENGRYAVQRATDRFKTEANQAKRDVEALAAELVDITKPREDELDKLIRDREEAIAAEKAEKARIEAERVATHRRNLQYLSAQSFAARGRPSVEIAQCIAAVRQWTITDDWEEFKAEAEAARERALDELLTEHIAAVGREQEAAQVEAQRLENERVAREQAERQAELDRQAAELRRQQEEVEAAQQRAAEAARQERIRAEEAERAQAEQQRAAEAALQASTKPAEPVAAAQAATASWQTPIGTLAPDAPRHPMFKEAEAVVITSAAAKPEPEPATITLGDLQARLGIAGKPLMLSADYLAALGFPFTPVKAAKLYRETDVPLICAALSEHLLTVGEAQR